MRAALRMLRGDAGEQEELAKALSQASAAAAYAGGITRHLRSFLGRQGSQSVAVDLRNLIANATKLTEAEARDHDVRIDAECAPGLPLVLGEPVDIEQVLISLISNSIEAMRSVAYPVRRIALPARRLQGRVQVSVEDSGPGMDRACAARAFQPFYTTKHDGIGVGLSISCAIVEAHGGKLWAEP